MSAKRQAGGKRGRPKGSRNMSTILRELASELVVVRDARGSRKVPLKEALLLKLRQLMVQGDIKSDKFADKLRAQVAPEQAALPGLLVVPEPMSEEEWIRRAEIENQFKQAPEDPFPKAPPPVPPTALKSGVPGGAATTVLPPKRAPRLIR